MPQIYGYPKRGVSQALTEQNMDAQDVETVPADSHLLFDLICILLLIATCLKPDVL